MQGGADAHVDEARGIELGGVDVVHTELDGPSQHGEGRPVVPILKLHRAVPDTGNGPPIQGPDPTRTAERRGLTEGHVMTPIAANLQTGGPSET